MKREPVSLDEYLEHMDDVEHLPSWRADVDSLVYYDVLRSRGLKLKDYRYDRNFSKRVLFRALLDLKAHNLIYQHEGRFYPIWIR